MTLLAIVVIATLGISAFCSLFEATLFSTRPAALEAARVHGNESNKLRAERFLLMKANLSRPTSAILILNTIANTAGATVAGMLAADALGADAMPVFSGAMTLGILFISEIFPKTYGATQWRNMWPRIVWPLAAMVAVLRPMIFVTQLIAKLFVPKVKHRSSSDEEILAMIRLSGRAGQLTPSEQELVIRAFAFDEITVGEVMIPIEEVVTIDAGWDQAKCLKYAHDSKHTRYPLIRGGLDEILGLVHIKDLIGISAGTALSEVVRPLGRVPESVPLQHTLREMQRTRQHMSLVINGEAKVVGIVTIEDALGQMVGTVEEEPQQSLEQKAGGVFLAPGSLPMVELNQKLGLDIDHASDIDTLSSLMVSRLGRLLVEGDAVEFEELRAEVVEVVGTRATIVRLLPLPQMRPTAER